MKLKSTIIKIASIALISLLTYSSPLYASDRVTLQVDGNSYPLKITPIIENGTTLVGLREMFEILGTTVDWNQDTGVIKAKTGEVEISLISGTKLANKNGIPIELATAPRQIDGRIMVPLRFVSEAFGAEVIWDETNHIIIIDTTPEKEIRAQEMNPIEYPRLMVYEEGETVSYEEAVEKAMKNNLSIKIIEEDITIAREKQEDAHNLVIFHRPFVEDYTAPEAYFTAETVHLNTLLAMIQADYGAQAAKYQKQIQEGVIKYQVKALFDSIVNLKKDLELSNKALEITKINLESTNQKAALGLESEYNKIKTEQDYEKQQKQLEALKKSLDNEYIKLNRLMGIDVKARNPLEYVLQYTPLEEISLDSYIERSIEKDPIIKLKEQAVAQAEYSLHIYPSTGLDNFTVRESQLKQARMEAVQVKNNLRDKLHTTYNQIKQLEEQYQIDTVNLQQAKEQYNILKTQYDLGMVIELNLKQAELAILSAQVAQEKTAVQHAQLVYLFNNPYLLSQQ